jgi:hypothetical protein
MQRHNMLRLLAPKLGTAISPHGYGETTWRIAMSTSKHSPSGHTPTTLPRDDLEDNPAIGSSKGTTMSGEDPHILQGENTDEGDVENDTDGTGRITRQDQHRTNP